MGSEPLELRAADKAYGGRAVLRGLDLVIEPGAVLVVLGHSGSGKTTLLRVLAGLEELDGGELLRGGRPVTPRPRTGVVFQQPLLLPWLTVRENAALGLGYRANRGRVPDPAAEVETLLGWLGLAELADASPAALSGGQAQRVAIARALAIRPELLLLDEPFSALDPVTRADLQDRLRTLIRELHLTVVLVTHDVDEALYLGDRIALLDGSGRVAQEWTPPRADRDRLRTDPIRAEILARYGNARAARAEVAG